MHSVHQVSFKEQVATGNHFKVIYTCIAIGGSGGLACEKAVTQLTSNTAGHVHAYNITAQYISVCGGDDL